MISVRSRGREETLELEEFEARVRDGRVLPSTLVRLPVVTGERWVRAKELDLFRRLYAPAHVHFSRSFTLGRFPWFTAAFCVVQIAIFFSLAGLEPSLAIDPLIDAGAKVQPNILELGETWRLLTANVLHRDRNHLLFNMFFLFNVGGAIENAYRVRDYVFMLVLSAVTTTALSTLIEPHPFRSASGMILGMFGAASVFGFKFGLLLPKRYRRYFGGAALPYALFILYVGLTTRDTDNWGHLGGLLGGMAAALPLSPRLALDLRERVTWRSRVGSLSVTGLVIAFVFALSPLLRAVGPRYESLTDERSGVSFVYPATWFSGQNHLGYPAKGNTLGTSIGLRAETRDSEPYTLREVRSWFLEQELGVLEQRGDVTRVVVLQERPFVLAGARALELRIALESRAGSQLTRNILIERGYYRYAIVLSAPTRWAEGYAEILEEMASRIALVEPAPLFAAREKARVFSGMTSALVALGRELTRTGLPEEASLAFQEALTIEPRDRDAAYGLAKVTSDYGGDVARAAGIAESLWRRDPDEPAIAALLADLRERLGQREAACEVLLATFDRLDQPPEALRERVVELRCLRSY
ncbi:MAG: rhomboid family intramembrane serine protease [Myxococcales bacterium]|nr:rhomboid family intramembrane serine protease [Myxococcales bacterium]